MGGEIILNTFTDYNKFEQLPMMQYNIIEHLMLYNENIWKMLKYPDNSALDKPNLTQEEKAGLIYDGKTPLSNNFRVFFTDYMDDSFTEQCSILRVFPEVITPTNNIVSIITFRIEVFSHLKIQMLDNYTTRNVQLLQQVLSTLNGQLINSIGVLAFDKRGCPYDRAVLNISNSKSYTGYSISMSTHTA